MGAGMPLIVTCTLPSVVGKGIPDATWVPEARLTPYSVSNSPGARPAVEGAKLPAFTMPCGFRNTPVALKLLVMVGNGIRIGSGIGPYLGLSVALQAPTMPSSLSATGVFLNPQGVVNAGSSAPFTAGLAPGELLTLYGVNLASGTQVASGIPFPTTLGNVQVMIDNIPAPIYYVTATQLSAIVPYGVTGSIAKVQVFNNNVASNSVTALIAKTAPGVLTQLQNGLGYGDVVHSDGTLVNANHPAQIGETVSVYLTGL